jgi:hypothetical protein
MVASRLVSVEHAIPAQTDHCQHNGGVIGPAASDIFFAN